MRCSIALCLAVALLSPVAARSAARESAAPIEDRPGLKLNEVERGFFFGAEGGGLFLFGPKASKGSALTLGRTMGLSVGGDIANVVALSVLVLGTHSDTPQGFESSGASNMKGDFSTLILGAMAKVYLPGIQDQNGIQRVFVYLRGGAGTAFIGPKSFYPGNDFVLFGGGGIEYFTHLRHFSIGIDADFLVGVSYLGAGLMLSPNLRYTF
jgi:hypothetical protein